MIDVTALRARLEAAVIEADAAQLADVAAELRRAEWRLEQRRALPAPMTAPAPAPMTAPEIAARLGVPASWVYELARNGRIPVRRLGRYRRFDLAAVEAAIEAGQGGDSKPVPLGTTAKPKRSKGCRGAATALLPTPAEVHHG